MSRHDRVDWVRAAVLVAFALAIASSSVGCDDDVSGPQILRLSPDPLILHEGRHALLTVTGAKGWVYPWNPVYWKSSDYSVASVSWLPVQGNNPMPVTGIGEGEAEITVSQQSSGSGRATIVVIGVSVDSLAIHPRESVLTPGEFVDLRAVARDSVGVALSRELSWSCSDTQIVSLRPLAMLPPTPFASEYQAMGHMLGHAIITVQYGGLTASTVVDVVPAPSP